MNQVILAGMICVAIGMSLIVKGFYLELDKKVENRTGMNLGITQVTIEKEGWSRDGKPLKSIYLLEATPEEGKP